MWQVTINHFPCSKALHVFFESFTNNKNTKLSFFVKFVERTPNTTSQAEMKLERREDPDNPDYYVPIIGMQEEKNEWIGNGGMRQEVMFSIPYF